MLKLGQCCHITRLQLPLDDWKKNTSWWSQMLGRLVHMAAHHGIDTNTPERGNKGHLVINACTAPTGGSNIHTWYIRMHVDLAARVFHYFRSVNYIAWICARCTHAEFIVPFARLIYRKGHAELLQRSRSISAHAWSVKLYILNWKLAHM